MLRQTQSGSRQRQDCPTHLKDFALDKQELLQTNWFLAGSDKTVCLAYIPMNLVARQHVILSTTEPRDACWTADISVPFRQQSMLDGVFSHPGTPRTDFVFELERYLTIVQCGVRH
jgi:hypothetical protein